MPIADLVIGVVSSSLVAAGQALTADYIAGCKKRLIDERRRPGENDVAKGVRTAQLLAVRQVVKTHKSILEGIPDHEVDRRREEQFASLVEKHLNAELKIFRGHKLKTDALRFDDLEHVLDEILSDSKQADSDPLASDLKAQANKSALKELEAKTELTAPALFRQAFVGTIGGVGWYETFSLFIVEELIANERFRTVFEAGQLVDLKGSMQQLITETHANHNELIGYFDSVRDQIGSIEQKVDALLEQQNVRDAAAKLEAELGLTRQAVRGLAQVVLKREVQNDQIIPSLFEMAINWKDLAPTGSTSPLSKSTPELVRLREEAASTYAADDVERFYELQSQIVDLEERSLERIKDEQRILANFAQQRETDLIGSLKQKERAARATLDADGVVDALLRRLELEESSEVMRLLRLQNIETDWFKRGVVQGQNFDLMLAIALEEQRLSQTSSSSDPYYWVSLKKKLGDLDQTLGERQADNCRLAKAIQSYKDALPVLLRLNQRTAWAKTQYSLGGALKALGEREVGNGRLKEAVRALRRSHSHWTQAEFPLDWARCQNSLGTVFQALGERKARSLHLEKAISAYKNSLEEITVQADEELWATIQNNLGNTLRCQGERHFNNDYFIKSINAHKSALLVWSQQSAPLNWAMTKNNLGLALSSLGLREKDTAPLEEAVAVYREALLEYSRNRVPLDWAMTQNNLGLALRALGELNCSEQLLKEAASAHQEALTEWTQDRVPLRWANAMSNLGVSLCLLSELVAGTTNLKNAIHVFTQVLSIRTRDQFPFDWGKTQNSLGNALRCLGEREFEASYLNEAQRIYGEVLSESLLKETPELLVMVNLNLARLQIAFMQQKPKYGDETEAQRNRELGLKYIDAAVEIMGTEQRTWHQHNIDILRNALAQ